MNNHIEKYLDELREALNGLDKATIQDALADSEDHLNSALNAELDENPEQDKNAVIEKVIEMYGSPEEIRDLYAGIEEHTTPVFSISSTGKKSGLEKFAGIIADPGAWAASIYMLISLFSGCIYFTFIAMGISISTSLVLLIIGIPVCMLFLLVVRGIGLVEGRLVEALLGTRMPRRAVVPRGDSFWSKFTGILKAGSTWKTMVYMALQMPLGIMYFTLFITLFSIGLSFLGAPVIQYGFNEPFISDYNLPVYAMPFVMAFGVLLLMATLHLNKAIGHLHGRYAKAMLVS